MQPIMVPQGQPQQPERILDPFRAADELVRLIGQKLFEAEQIARAQTREDEPPFHLGMRAYLEFFNQLRDSLSNEGWEYHVINKALGCFLSPVGFSDVRIRLLVVRGERAGAHFRVNRRGNMTWSLIRCENARFSKIPSLPLDWGEEDTKLPDWQNVFLLSQCIGKNAHDAHIVFATDLKEGRTLLVSEDSLSIRSEMKADSGIDIDGHFESVDIDVIIEENSDEEPEK